MTTNIKYKQEESIEWLGATELLVAIEPDKVDFVKNIIDSISKISIDLELWQSKYNSYVVYDYRPFSSTGFIANLHLIGDVDYLNFAKVEIEKSIEQRKRLERIFESD